MAIMHLLGITLAASTLSAALPASGFVPFGNKHVERQAANSTAPSSISSSPPSPTPSPWHVDIKVGSSSFYMGNGVDQPNPNSFEGLWKNVCDGTGCDGGTPQTFNFQGGYNGDFLTTVDGSFTMTGNVDNDQDVTTYLLDAISAALLASQSCRTITVDYCRTKRDPQGEGPSWGNACDGTEGLVSCTAANYVQATVYDDQSSQKGQITMQGSTADPYSFDCSSLSDAMNAALVPFADNPIFGEAGALISLACDVASK